MKFFICKHCGNIIKMIKESGAPVSCCGEKMQELIPCSTDGAFDKHVPVVTTEGNTVCVKVGENEHPMIDAHYIEWVSIETEKGCQTINLAPGMKPEAKFILTDGDKLIAAYAYCNLHGLWKK